MAPATMIIWGLWLLGFNRMDCDRGRTNHMGLLGFVERVGSRIVGEDVCARKGSVQAQVGAWPGGRWMRGEGGAGKGGPGRRGGWSGFCAHREACTCAEEERRMVVCLVPWSTLLT